MSVCKGRVWLVDLNPFGEVTDSLLFSWAELTSGGEIAQRQVRPVALATRSPSRRAKTHRRLVAGRAGFPLHHQWGDGAAKSLPELSNPTGLCGPVHRRGRLQAHRLPQAGECGLNQKNVVLIAQHTNHHHHHHHHPYHIFGRFMMQIRSGGVKNYFV